MPWINGKYYSDEDVPMAQNINEQHDVIKEDDGLSCLKYGLRVKYQQFQREQTASGVKTTIVLQGSYDDCKKAMEGDGSGMQPNFIINHSHQTYGNLESMRLIPDEGPFWNLELVYTTEINWLGQSTSKGSTYGKTTSELNCRMMSRDLYTHPKYRKRWNLNLYATEENLLNKISSSAAAEIRGKWTTAGRHWSSSTQEYVMQDGLSAYFWKGIDAEYPAMLDGNCLAWGTSLNDLPDVSEAAAFKSGWFEIIPMEKPGVVYYECPVYELTEVAKAASKSKTAWNVSKKLGKISEPSEGDFGVKKTLGGNWLCEGASTRFDGKYWLTTFTFLHSGDEHGWDTDLYSSEDE